MLEQNHYVYEFGPFQLDATRRVLLKEGEPLKLFPKEFDTLLALVERSGELLEKDDLMRQVWQNTIVEESNLTTNISHLRKVLGESRDRHDYIVTVPGRGYRFVAGVRQTFDEVIVRERTRITVEKEEEAAESSAEYSLPLVRSNGDPVRTELAARAVETLPANSRNERLVNADQLALNVANAATLPVTAPVAARRKTWFSLALATVLITVSVSGFFYSRFLRGKAQPQPFQNVTLKQLTTNSRTTLATLSPDGKLFVYVSRVGGHESFWLGHVGGGEPVALGTPEDVTYRSMNFSPDGGSLYYVADSDKYLRGALFRMPVLGGVPEKLRENVGVKVAFAPDMKQFAYVRGDAEKKVSSVVIADTEGAGERELVWRPDHLPFRSPSPSWSPDGAKLAVGAVTDEKGESSEVFVMSVADGQIKPLTALAWHSVFSTVWLPDGSGLVMVAKEKGAWDSIQLWHISYPDGAARRILSDLDNYGSALSLSSDGQLLLATQDQRINNVWVAPAADLSQAKQITFSSIGRRDGWGGLDWTPEGKLLYGAIIRESLTIWTMGADGDNQKQLTSAGHMDQYLSLPADGRYMVFETNRSGDSEIWRANADGGDMRQLTTGGGNAKPHVSPDGKWVVYESLREGLRTIWRVSIEGGEPVRLADRPASWPRVSPDGKLIACEYEGQLKPPRTQLAVIPIEGGRPVKVFDIPRLANFNYGARWTPDGKAVTYRDWVNGIWRQPLGGGKPERLTGLPEEKLYAYAWSRDGRHFAFVRGAAELRDVILLRNTK
jgi:Tol biopolymer transport system component/DNA-binding winged helix-turn-helix (wHTH) protein